MKDGKPEGYGRAFTVTAESMKVNGKMLNLTVRYTYYANLNLWYEGEWKEGKREGLGTSYYEDGKPAFAGEWKGGKPLK